MSEFIVGNKTIGSTKENSKEVETINQLLTPVTKETLEPIKLSDENQAAITLVKDAIDIMDIDGITTYGSQEGSELQEITSKTLSNIKTSDLGSIGNSIAELTTILSTKNIDEDEPGIFKLFKKSSNKLKSMKIRFESAQSNITRIMDQLDNHTLILTRDNKDMMLMKEANKLHYQRLRVYIEAGRQRLEEIRENELVDAIEKASTDDQLATSDLTELKNRIQNFEQRISDLDGLLSVSQLLAIQIETMMNGNIAMIQKMKTTKTTTLPVWEVYMTIAFYGENSKQAVEIQSQISNMTQELLIETSKAVGLTARKTEEEAQRNIIDVETIEIMNNEIIQTLQDIDTIRIAGRDNKIQAAKKLQDMRTDLSNQLIKTIDNAKTV